MESDPNLICNIKNLKIQKDNYNPTNTISKKKKYQKFKSIGYIVSFVRYYHSLDIGEKSIVIAKHMSNSIANEIFKLELKISKIESHPEIYSQIDNQKIIKKQIKILYEYLAVLIIYSDKELKYILIITLMKIIERKILKNKSDIFEDKKNKFIFETLLKNDFKTLTNYMNMYQNILEKYFEFHKLNGKIEYEDLCRYFVIQFAYYLDLLLNKLNFKSTIDIDLSYCKNNSTIGKIFLGYLIENGYCNKIDFSFSQNIDYTYILEKIYKSTFEYITIDLRGVDLTKKMINIINDIRRCSYTKTIIFGEKENNLNNIKSKQLNSKSFNREIVVSNSNNTDFNYEISDNVEVNRERKRNNKVLKKHSLNYGKGGYFK